MNYKKILKLLGVLIFAISIGAQLYIGAPAASAASNTPLSVSGSGTLIKPYGQPEPIDIELCVHVGAAAGTDTDSNTTVDAYQASDPTTAIPMTYHATAPVSGSGCDDSFVATFDNTTTSAPGEQCNNADKITITAKTKTGTDSAIGTINVCGENTGYIYNLTPNLILATGGTPITVTFDVYYCASDNPCAATTFDANQIQQNAYFGPSSSSDDCVDNPNQTGCLTFTDNSSGVATASIMVPVPGTYTLTMTALINGENPYYVPSNQSSYPFTATSNSQTVTVDLEDDASVPVTPTGPTTPGGGTDCATNPNAASCQGQTVTCSIVWHNPLSWFVCPAVSSIQDIMNSLGSAITKYLTIPSYYFNAGSTTGNHCMRPGIVSGTLLWPYWPLLHW